MDSQYPIGLVIVFAIITAMAPIWFIIFIHIVLLPWTMYMVWKDKEGRRNW